MQKTIVAVKGRIITLYFEKTIISKFNLKREDKKELLRPSIKEERAVNIKKSTSTNLIDAMNKF